MNVVSLALKSGPIFIYYALITPQGRPKSVPFEKCKKEAIPWTVFIGTLQKYYPNRGACIYGLFIGKL